MAPYWQSYTFYQSGNRKTEVDHTVAGDVTKTYAYPASGAQSSGPHQLQSVSTAGPNGTAQDTYTYDESGDLKTRDVGGDTGGHMTYSAGGATPAEQAKLGFWSLIGLAADASAIVTTFVQGITTVAVVACVIAFLASLRPVTARLRGAVRFGAVLLLITVAVAVVMAIGPERIKAWASAPTTPGVTDMTGGCKPFQVYAQNRWQPYGTRVLAAPNLASKQLRGEPPNKTLYVDGWVHGATTYPLNPPPWNSDVYFADGTGWVTFAGVRAVATPQESTGLSPNGGEPVPVITSCEGAVS